MNKSSALGLLLGVMAVCAVLPWGAGSVSHVDGICGASGGRQSSGPDILFFTQFADLSWEYPNTRTSIDETYGTNYNSEELTDYTGLGAILNLYDILVIPEQEGSSYSLMTTVGNSWSTLLPDFVDGGGIVIVLDFAAYGPQYGVGLYLCQQVGLLTYVTITSTTSGTLTVSAGSDPLADGVASSFTSVGGTLSFSTSESTVVVRHSGSGNPVVLHKTSGSGHIVYLGFDLYQRSPSYDRILANAISLYPGDPFSGGLLANPGIVLVVVTTVVIVVVISTILLVMRKRGMLV